MAHVGFKVMDSDMHVMEPADLWVRCIEPEFRDQAPRGTHKFATDVHLEHEGRLISRREKQNPYEAELTDDFATAYGRTQIFDEYERRGWGPDTQIEAMDKEGIDVAVLFPSLGLFAHAKEYESNRLAAAISRAYNNWLAEFCSYAPARMYGAALLAAQDVKAAVAEVRRAKQGLGFKAVFLRPNPVLRRNWHDPAYDPLWAECEKQDMAVGFHEGLPCALPVAMADRFDGRYEDLWTTEHVACHPVEQMYACLSMIMGGVLERFPGLRVAFLEGNCSWLPFWLWRMTEHYEHRERALKKRLPLSPTEYFKRQCYAGVEADEGIAKYVFDWMGNSNIVFSTDYPHPDSRFPGSVKTLVEQPFSEDSKRKVLWDNCARLYNFA